MKSQKHLIVALFVVYGLLVSIVEAQLPDFTKHTLTFTDVTAERLNQSVVEHLQGNEKDIDFGDYDNDGDLDVVIAVARSDFGQRRNKLYRNDAGTLNEVSGSSVIEDFSIDDHARAALFRDFDNDGFQDLIIVCDANNGSGSNTAPGKTKYFRNVLGQSFVNESGRLNGLVGAASHGAAADLDGNGFLDLVICDHPNINQDKISFNMIDGNGPGEFEDLTNTHIPADNEYGKFVSVADMNGDGQPDILMASHVSDTSFIYYNNNNDAGSGMGDFRYGGPGEKTALPSTSGSILERALVPGDFNNDGKMDFYFANEGGFGASLSDAIYVNIGNDENNKAVFAPQALSSKLDDETMKGAVSDLDGDGREDLLIMADNRRPYVFRNTSENGAVSFVEWTPAVFTLLHEGWHALSGNLTGNGSQDIFVGAYQDDFLFEGGNSELFEADSLAGGLLLPDFHDSTPVSVFGEVGFGANRSFLAVNLPAGANVSVLLRSIGDLNLTISENGNELATSNRVGHGTDEAVEFVVPAAGNVTFEIGVDGLSFDGNGDGIVNLLDIGSFIDCLSGNSNDCDPFDINDNGDLNLLLVQPFVDAISNIKSSETFVIEFLSRTD